MAEIDLTNVFDDCVDRLARGQSLDDCLRRYPQYSSTLRPMLEAGLLVQRMRVHPTELVAAQTRVRNRYEDALRAPPPKRTGFIRQFTYAIAAIFMIGFITFGSLTAVSQNSLPGDAMYGIKTFSEGLQRSLFDNEALEASFDQRRVQEILQLLALGRVEDVAFTGTIAAQNGTNWVIASLPIIVSPDIPNASASKIGDQVSVTARTSEVHTLTALSILISESATAPLPTPTSTLVPTVNVPSQTPSPNLTPTITVTSTPRSSATNLVPSLTPFPTQMPSPAISAVPQIIILTPTECVASRPTGWVSYQIKSGDTLSALASGQSISLGELMSVNCISDASHIVVGETIYLPKTPSIAPTVTSNSQSSGNNNSGSNNSGGSSPTDDHEGGSDGGHGGSSGGGSDDGSGHT